MPECAKCTPPCNAGSRGPSGRRICAQSTPLDTARRACFVQSLLVRFGRKAHNRAPQDTQNDFLIDRKSHFHVFWSKIRISLNIYTPLRLVVRLTNFRDFREKSKIWPKIWVKTRFSTYFCPKNPFILKGMILPHMPDDTVFDGQLLCIDRYAHTIMIWSYWIAEKYGF